MKSSYHLVPGLLAIALTGACGGLQTAHGQSYLEKLEQLIEKSKANAAASRPDATTDTPPESSVEELPMPQKRPVVVPEPAAGAGNAPAVKGPALEPPTGPATIEPPDRQTAAPRGDPARPRPTYLGIEAEDPVTGGLGVRVTRVTRDSPAWKAGFEVGDRIVGVDGFAIANLESMAARLGKTMPGDDCRFQVTRGARNLSLTAVLMDAELANRIRNDASTIEADGTAWLGIQVNDLTPHFREQFRISVFKGAAVTSIDWNSPAAKAGIKPGECIVDISGHPIEDAADLHSWMRKARPGERVQLRVYHGGSVKIIALVLGRDPSETRRQPGRQLVSPQPTGVSSPQLTPTRAPPPVAQTRSPDTPVVTANPASGEQAVRIEELEREVAELTSQLQAATAKLADTEQLLNKLLKDLGADELPQ